MPTQSTSPEATETDFLSPGHLDLMDSVDTPTPKPLTDLATWGGRNDSKLVLSDAAVKKVARKSLSPSTADSMSGCCARWAIEKLLPRVDDPFGAAELGTAAHRVFETVFDMPADERTTQVAMEVIAKLQDDEDDNLAIPKDPVDYDRWHSSVTRLVTGLWQIENPREVEIIGNEIEIKDVEIGGVPFFGYIDRYGIKTVDEKRARVIGDYKSGRVPNLHFGDKHGEQLRIYALALAASEKYEKPEAAEVLYTQHLELRVVDLSQSALNQTLEKFQKAWVTHNKQVASHEFSTKTTALCGWCPAVSVCPAGQKADKVAKREFDVAGEALGIGETSTQVAITAKPGQLSQSRGTTSVANTSMKEATDMYEPKPWEETNEDGSLNLNSYAATAVFGIVEIAVEELHANGQDITATNVRAYSQTLQAILEDVFRAIGDGEPTFASGRHTRLRGALRTSLQTLPSPFGGDAEAWERWIHRCIVRTKAIAKTSIALWDGESRVADPWLALVTSAQADDFADA